MVESDGMDWSYMEGEGFLGTCVCRLRRVGFLRSICTVYFGQKDKLIYCHKSHSSSF